MAKRKPSRALTWIINEAKKLRRKDHSRKEWKEYVAQASAIYARKHGGKSPVGKKKKQSRKKVSAVKFIERGERPNARGPIVRINRTRKGTFKNFKRLDGINTSSATHIDKNRIHANIQLGRITAGTLRSELKKRIKEKIDKAVVKKYHATKQRVKKKIQKTITAAKAELRRFE